MRRRLIVRGVVQGVGFRPFVAGLARRLGLGGVVRNVSGAVVVEVEGPEDALDAFAVALPRERPPLAAIEAVETAAIAPVGETAFVIDASASAEGRRTSIPPDVATCEACLRELRDPADRRYRYPFLNCTHRISAALLHVRRGRGGALHCCRRALGSYLDMMGKLNLVTCHG